MKKVNTEPTTDNTDIDPAEEQVDAVVEAASKVAANWIHSPKAIKALSEATGLGPFAVHLGFMFAHMFHHHAAKHGIPMPEFPTTETK